MERELNMAKKFMAALVALVAAAGLALTVAPTFVNAAGEGPIDWTLPENAAVGDATTESTIDVPPWCDWRIGSLDETVDLVPAEGQDLAYDGDAINLEYVGASINAYIGGSDGFVTKGADDNCSWFGATAVGAELVVAMAGSMFEATAEAGGRDEDMDFEADTGNPLVVSASFAEGCAAEGFIDGGLGSLDALNPTGEVWSVASGSASTNNFCSFSIDYGITIPANMSPTYGDTTYTWTGPSLTFTIQVPED